MTTEREQDAAAATVARARLRAEGPGRLAADPRVAPLLAPGERCIASRRAVTFDRRLAGLRDRPSGDLYVTTERLLLVGPAPISVPLDEIDDAAVIDESVVLLLTSGVALTLEADRPRLLRVQLAAARASRVKQYGRDL
jgi:hypothetical protein